MLRMPIFADELLPILFVGAGCLFIGSIILISSQTNPIYAVFSFILAALSAFFLLILLGAEFFALLILIIYIGVITILFLFVVFMYNLRVLTKFTFWFFIHPTCFATYLKTALICKICGDCVEESLNHTSNMFVTNYVTFDLFYLVELFNQHYVGFILVGFLIFFALIGSIVITFPFYKNIK